MKARQPVDAHTLAAYLEDEVTASQRSAIEVELENSAALRRTLAQMQRLSEHLSAPEPELEGIDLVARVRAALREPVPIRPVRRRSLPVWLAGLAACLGGLFLYVAHPTTSAEFHAKSNGVPGASDKRWAGIQIYRAGERGSPEPLKGPLGPRDGLLFSYTNLGSEPFDYLMIFAVDARGEVSWFYPAHELAGENPESVPISHDRANVPLGEVIRQDFAVGPLALYALFSRRPSSVQAVEDWVKQQGRPTTASPLPGGVLERIDAQVAR